MNLYLNADCMNPETGLPSYPDKYFDLAIVDPPYGIGMSGGNVGYKGFNNLERKEWDAETPNSAYFEELIRVSRNQIVFGGNYFPLPPSRCWIVWDKGAGFEGRTFAEAELAWTSFDANVRQFRFDPLAKGSYKGKMHPTQKPMALYRWLIKNYAKQGDKILDTHVGSASSLVVFEEMGFEYVGFELDKDYYRDSCKRLETFRAQPKLFTGSEIFEASQQKTLFDTK